MDSNEILLRAGADLATATIQNTASIVHDRIKNAKAKKDLKEQNNELQEIINDLLADKAELLRIAQVYEQEFVSQKITDKDIEFITKNIIPILMHFITDDQVKDLSKIANLLSKEALTILQLVGFNYKKAIGEPLTILVKNAIESKIQKPDEQISDKQLAIEMMRLAKDREASERFMEIANPGGVNEKRNNKI